MEGKKFSAVVDEEVLNAFRECVKRRYGKVRGALSEAVTEALKLWIEKYCEGEEEES